VEPVHVAGKRTAAADAPHSSEAQPRSARNQPASEQDIDMELAGIDVQMAGKRGREAAATPKEAQRTKKKRASNEPVDASENESKPGALLKIHLENFMCHTHLQVDFKPNINFIVGENGSGKSAILTALTVCFGENAKKTNRASSLKEFIKHGQTYALVSVTLRNNGPEAFDPHRYGGAITVERKISMSSASFQLFGHINGQKHKVGTQGKGDLDAILEHFSLDVSNPCTVMSQDASRSFLHSGRDEDKYKFFMKATLLESVRQGLLLTEENVTQMQGHVQVLEASVPGMKAELIKLKDQLIEAQAVEKLREQEGNVKKRLAWSFVYKKRASVQEIEDLLAEGPPPPDLSSHRAKMWGSAVRARGNMAVKKATETAKLQEADAEVKETSARMESHGQTMKGMVDSKKEVEQLLAQARRGVKKAETERIHHTNTINNNMQQKKDMETSMHRLQERFQNQTQASSHLADERKANAQADVRRASEQVTEANQLMGRAQQQVLQVSETVREFEGKEHEIGENIRHTKNELKQIEASSGKAVSNFGGQKVQDLLDLIKRNANRFEVPPVGPIGSSMTLKAQEWSTAVEVCLGRLLDSFIVGTFKDKNTLMALAKQVGCPQPTMYVVKDFNTQARYSEQRRSARLPKNGLLTMEHVLEFKSDAVFNLLIDQAGMDRTVLVETQSQGVQLVFKSGMPNIKEAFTQDGTKVFKKGQSQTILQNKNRRMAPRLASDNTAWAEQMKTELHGFEAARQEVMSAKQRELAEHRKLKEAHHRAHQDWKRAQKFFGQMETLLEELENEQRQTQQESVDDCDVSQIQEEVRLLDRTIEAAKEKAVAADEQRAEVELKMQDLERQAEEERVKVQSVARENDDMVTELTAANELMRKAISNLKHLETKLQTINGKIAERAEEGRVLRETLEEDVAKAQTLCMEDELDDIGGMPTETDAATHLNNKLASIRKAILKEESRPTGGLTVEELEYKVKQQDREVGKHLMKLKSVRVPAERFAVAVEKRKLALKKVAKMVGVGVSHQFNHYMKERGHTGKVKVDHKLGKLEMEVIMSGGTKNERVSNTKTLSGGERSYSTLAFSLALGSENESPFRAMDEFDVFMDAVNRRVGTEHLLDFAKKNPTLQFIYLTPQDVSMLDKHREDGFVHIQRMHNAAR